MDLTRSDPKLVVAVGAGGVGKTTLAASLGLASAEAGHDTLVMTFDPSLRLKDALGVDRAALDEEVDVPSETPGTLRASLLDARRTFDRLVRRYAPDEAAARRILTNSYYDRLAGHLGGILEYMAVERLYEVASTGRYARIVLDTPPTRQAIDFLEAPARVIDFLDSGALKIALRPWFDAEGHLSGSRRFGFLGQRLEEFLDRVVGLSLLRDMSEFFRAFEPLFEGFRGRAEKVREMLASDDTEFLLVSGPGESALPDTLFFARRLVEAGYELGPIVVNRLHPRLDPASRPEGPAEEGWRVLHWLGERDAKGLERLRGLMPDRVVLGMPLEHEQPTDLPSLAKIGRAYREAWAAR